MVNVITKEHLSQHDRNNTGVILGILGVMGLPSSLLDVGSGSGIMTNLCRRLGIDAVGVDLLAETPDIRHDLNEPLNLGRTFGIVISLETAEHIKPEKSEMLADLLTSHLAPGGILVFTAAVPGQKGCGHVNCRPLEFWREQFEQRGMIYDHDKTEHLRIVWNYTAGGLSAWLCKNIQVFTK